jgi:type II secretory pathway pseudopilin PulG
VKRHGKGWNLLELLLVVGIILAVLSLVVGVVRIGLEVARKTQCANNLRQIYLATKLYEDYFGAPPITIKNFVTWKPELAPLLICPSDPLQGNEFKDSYKPEVFVPHSYFFNYWADYLLVRLPRENIHAPEEQRNRLLKSCWRELTSPDGHWFVCPIHELAVFPDGRVGKARRYTKADFENPQNLLR